MIFLSLLTLGSYQTGKCEQIVGPAIHISFTVDPFFTAGRRNPSYRFVGQLIQMRVIVDKTAKGRIPFVAVVRRGFLFSFFHVRSLRYLYFFLNFNALIQICHPVATDYNL